MQLNYLLKAPKYLATCLFGVSFVILANTATSSVAFAVAVLQAAGAPRTVGAVAGIAIAVNAFSCLLHGLSRIWGVRMNNMFGILKVLMLVILILFGFVFLDRSVAGPNFDRTTTFSKTPGGISQFTTALVSAIFPFGGFHQPNYVSALYRATDQECHADRNEQVLGEIKSPRKNFAWASAIAGLAVCILFVGINVLYVSITRLLMSNVDNELRTYHRAACCHSERGALPNRQRSRERVLDSDHRSQL